MPVRRVILWLALSIIILGNATSGRADISNAGAVFLQRVNSAKANGMGGCVVTTVSEESAYYNPASIGLLHLDRAVSFVAPHSTEWLPEVADDLRLKSWSLSVGASRRLLKKSAPEQDNISFGLAYSYASLNYGTFTRVAETGEVIDQFESYDAANCLAVGFGYQHKVRIGFGYAIKFIE